MKKKNHINILGIIGEEIILSITLKCCLSNSFYLVYLIFIKYLHAYCYLFAILKSTEHNLFLESILKISPGIWGLHSSWKIKIFYLGA